MLVCLNFILVLSNRVITFCYLTNIKWAKNLLLNLDVTAFFLVGNMLGVDNMTVYNIQETRVSGCLT